MRQGRRGRFRPNDPVTRGEMAAFIYRLAGATQKGQNYSPFKDMGWSTGFYHEVSWLELKGIAGRGDVNRPVTSPLPGGAGNASGATAAWKTRAATWAAAKARSSSSYYIYGGNGPNGYDCSGFIVGAFAAGGKGGLPRCRPVPGR